MSIKIIIIINSYKMKPLTVSLILLNEITLEEQFNYELSKGEEKTLRATQVVVIIISEKNRAYVTSSLIWLDIVSNLSFEKTLPSEVSTHQIVRKYLIRVITYSLKKKRSRYRSTHSCTNTSSLSYFVLKKLYVKFSRVFNG